MDTHLLPTIVVYLEIVLLLSVPVLLVLFVAKGVTGAARRDPHTGGPMPTLEKSTWAAPGSRLSMMRYVVLVLLVADVSFEAIRERSQAPGGLSVAQSTKQASAAWDLERTLFPRPIRLYRPTWMPGGFRAASVSNSYLTGGGPANTHTSIMYFVGTYDTAATFTLEHVDATSTLALIQTLHPDWSVPLRIGALSGELIGNAATKHAAFVWQIGQWSYSAQMVGIDLSDFLRIVAGLQLV